MPTLVSMIRGINVGGSRPLRMEALRGVYERLGFRNVRSYLQSGNVVCEARRADPAAHAAAVERAILGDCGFGVSVAVRTAQAMAGVLAANPLLKRRSVAPAFLHATFLIGAKSPSLRGISAPLGPGEEAVLVDDVVFLYCPNGYGVTKINNAYFERALSTRATTRNWRTVLALERIARGEPS